ncbi:zinc finger, C2H2 type, partial [Teladorsagia circumcincta]
KGHLTQHLMIHSGGRPHQCNLCQKTFIFKFDLNRHMKIHAERGYSCRQCGRSFTRQQSLDEHALKCKTK